MKRNTVAAWIGASVLVATEIGLIVRAQIGVGAKRANAAAVQVDRVAGDVSRRAAIPLSDEKLDGEQQRADRDGHVQRIALDSVVAEKLSVPPLPSRVMPGPVPRSTQFGAEQPTGLSASPPAPSKTLPEIRP